MTRYQMKKVALILKDTIPPFMYRRVLSLYGRWAFSRYPFRHEVAFNCYLHGLKEDSCVFLLCPGPSLAQEDLLQLCGYDCVTVSNAALHPAVKTLRPLWHFIAPDHPKEVLPEYVKWMRQADSVLPPTTEVFLGHETRSVVKEHKPFSDRRQLRYLFFAPTETPYNPVSLSGVMMEPQSVTTMALPVLIGMGYSRIYLLGCDHTVLRDRGKRIKYFNSNAEDIRVTYEKGLSWGSTLRDLEAEARLHEQYRSYALLVASMQHGPFIMNLSQDSWLDAFPRDTLSNVLKMEESYAKVAGLR